MENTIQLKENKPNLKFILTITFVIAFGASLSMKCLEFAYLNTSMSINLFEVRGVWVTGVAIIIYLYALYTKKKALYVVSIVVLILAFIYTTYIFLNLNSLLETYDEVAKNYIHLKEGVFFYYISHFILLVSMIIPEKGFKDASQVTDEKEIYGLEDEEGYILADYIYGIEKRPDLYKKISVLATKEEIDNLEIIIDPSNETKFIIPKSNIISITAKSGTISKETMTTSNYGIAENIRDIALFGGAAGSFISYIRGDKVKDYYKIETTTIYDILIEYQNEKGEVKKIMFQTKKNPNEFLKQFKEKYTKH